MVGDLRRAKELLRQAARRSPEPVKRQLRRLVTRRQGVENQTILGRNLRVEGHNHGEVDYDDAWLIGLLAESDGFLDIGCNIGFFSLASCMLRPESTVLAIDANPECAAVTAANLVRNGFGDRSRAISTFVSDTRREVRFNTVGLGAAGSGLDGLSRTAEDLGSASTVQSDTLDALVEMTHFKPDLVKVDVEGAEREVLAGAVRTVAAHHPRFMVEMHSGGDLTMEQNATDVLSWCSAKGYEAWYLSTGEQLVDAATVAHRGRCHLLLQPADTPYPAVLEGVPQRAPIEMVLDRIGWDGRQSLGA